MNDANRERILARFMQFVNKTESCWLWTGCSDLSRGGARYARFWICGRTIHASRAIYELLVGPIPDGFTIDHVKARGCTSTLCVNPAHLESVPSRINLLRGGAPAANNARRTHCLREHELSGSNIKIDKNGFRHCVECERRRGREWKRRHYVPVGAKS